MSDNNFFDSLVFKFIMKYKFPIIIVLIFSAISLSLILGFAKVDNKKVIEVPKKSVLPDTTFTLLFGGDFMGHKPMILSAYNDSTQLYDYNNWFKFIAPHIKNCDWACANLEVTLAGEPFSGYPQFSSPDAYAQAIKNAGFDFLVTANNHSQDRGSSGLERTIKVLDSLSIAHTGTFSDTSIFNSTYPSIINVADCKIAILNYTYGTNGLNVKNPNIVNMIDSASMVRDVKKSKTMGANLIIPVMHWGLEYQTKENEGQQKTASLLSNAGVNAIIGMHPHVVEPVKFIKTNFKKQQQDSIPVAYSLGNFISNQRDRYCDGGVLVRLTISRKKNKYSITTVDYLPFWVWRLESYNEENNLVKGYYPITKQQMGMLPSDDSTKAALFFDDVKSIITQINEWNPN
jgi:poly-gamma-glutamate capsule biosynthesis protein CapA/YwtB (metallophosphatase superfamily)